MQRNFGPGNKLVLTTETNVNLSPYYSLPQAFNIATVMFEPLTR
jgi:hypothetical protein